MARSMTVRRTVEAGLRTFYEGTWEGREIVLVLSRVGKVAGAQLAPDGRSVVVSLRINSGVIIRRDARFVIEQAGFLGDQYVAIVPTENLGEPLPDGEVLEADLVVSFKVFRERFGSRVTLLPEARRIETVYIDGPFKHMKSHWAFADQPGGGVDRIFDSEGRNAIAIEGAEGQQLSAYLLGRDLWLTLNDSPVAVVERYDLNRENWATIRAGERVVGGQVALNPHRARERGERREDHQRDRRRGHVIAFVVGALVQERRRHHHPPVEVVDIVALNATRNDTGGAMALTGTGALFTAEPVITKASASPATRAYSPRTSVSWMWAGLKRMAARSGPTSGTSERSADTCLRSATR